MAFNAKTQRDIEAILQWAYRDELPKKLISSATGIWGQIEDGLGGVDRGHGAAQRYPHFGLPHPDAHLVEKAVSQLPDAVIDWDREAHSILGDMLALADPRSKETAAKPARRPVAGWTTGSGRIERVRLDRPREVILVRSLRTSALIAMHAGMGTRPNWREDQPIPLRIERGSKIWIEGECRGKNAYSTGSYCPLQWNPSPTVIAEARADYLAWWRGMEMLARTIILEEFEPLIPEAAEMPWITPEPKWTEVSRGTPRKLRQLPLSPARKLAGPKEQRKREKGRVLKGLDRGANY